MKDKTYIILAIVVALAIVGVGYLPAPPTPTAAEKPQGFWRTGPLPEGVPVNGLWPREGPPGYWDTEIVVYAGGKYFADVPGITVPIAQVPPMFWREVP